MNTTRCDSFEELVFTAPLTSVTAVSLLHITIVSVDRYIAVTRPLRYVTLVSTKRVQIVIVFLWILLMSDYHQPALAQVTLISFSISSAVNPLIYGYRDRLFREILSDLARRLTALILRLNSAIRSTH
ncbi:uncharacterized protein [Diadema setosum]|uniref:uncharacterized protein n=1 Tax=Diadema setosum TaxID=31175 RepID=UPI003B3AF571